MKLLLRLALVALLLVLLVVGAGFFFLGPIVGAAIGKGATYATGVESSVAKADVGIVNGALDLEDFRIGNPPGFTAPHFLAMKRARARWEGSTIFSERIEIPEFVLDGFELHLERNAKGSNWQAILDHLERVAGPAKEPAPQAEAGPERALHVRRIELKDLKVALHLADVPIGAGTHSLTLPTIVIEDFRSDGTTLEIVATLTRAVVGAVLEQSVKSGGGVLPKDVLENLDRGLEGLKERLEAEAGKRLQDGLESGVKKALEGVEGLFKPR